MQTLPSPLLMHDGSDNRPWPKGGIPPACIPSLVGQAEPEKLVAEKIATME
jgi:hypothetical protein